MARRRRRRRGSRHSPAGPRSPASGRRMPGASLRRGRPCSARASSAGRRATASISDATTTPLVRAAQGVVSLAQGRAVVAGERRLAAAGIARPRRPHADRQRAVPGVALGDRDRQQRPEPEAREVVDHRAHAPSASFGRRRLGARDALLRAHRGRALFAGQHQRRRHRRDGAERRSHPHRRGRARGAGLRRARQGPRRSAPASPMPTRRSSQNDKFPASVGKQQPRVPRWRAALLASYAPDERWSASVGVRYSGQQYGQLDNSDTQRLRLHRLQQVLRRRPPRPVPLQPLVAGLGRDRQRQRRPLLGVPSLPAAHLSRRASLRPVTRTRPPSIRRSIMNRFRRSLLARCLGGAASLALLLLVGRRFRARRERRRHRHRPSVRDAVARRHDHRRCLPGDAREHRNAAPTSWFAPARRWPRGSRSTRMAVDAQGVMRMREIDGIALAPKAKVQMRPGTGLHLMLVGLKEPLKEGATFPMTLAVRACRNGRGQGGGADAAGPPARRRAAHALSARVGCGAAAPRHFASARRASLMPAATSTSAGQCLQRRRGLAVAVAERDQRLQDVGLRARGDARRRRDGVAELALELEQQPLGGLLADPRHLDQPAAVLQADGARELVDRQAREDRERRARADARDLDQQAKGRPLLVA